MNRKTTRFEVSRAFRTSQNLTVCPGSSFVRWTIRTEPNRTIERWVSTTGTTTGTTTRRTSIRMNRCGLYRCAETTRVSRRRARASLSNDRTMQLEPNRQLD